MLSFNATLEAERAGEQGKAFGIVAQEVGKLAEISGKASQEIEKLIKDGESKVEEVLAQIQKRVSVGSAVTKDSVAVFNEISKRIEMVNGQIREISDAAKQQDQSAQLVTKSMKEIDQHSVNNAETTKQVTATSDDLKNESQKLNSAVGDLRFLIVGTAPKENV
jgi:methyl-accepting chemotaxis protein